MTGDADPMDRERHVSGQPPQNAAESRTKPDFGRWFEESGVWTGDDYLWLNRFRDLYAAYADAHSALFYIKLRYGRLDGVGWERVL